MKLDLPQLNALSQIACEMVENDLDYADTDILPNGYCLGLYADGVWVVDCSTTCDMNNMPRLLCLNEPND